MATRKRQGREVTREDQDLVGDEVRNPTGLSLTNKYRWLYMRIERNMRTDRTTSDAMLYRLPTSARSRRKARGSMQ